MLYFKSSEAAYDNIRELYDFIWPTAVALWNLRWQAEGYIKVRPDSTPAELSSRFVVGSGIHGANIKKACVDTPWDNQKTQFAKFVLFNIVSSYEYWIENLLNELSGNPKPDPKHFQFPSTTRRGKANGISVAINTITANEVAAIKNCIYPIMRMHKKYSYNNIENLMKCYRYFKECRNALAHNGGSVDTKLIDAYNEFSLVATTTDLGLSEVPEHIPPAAGGIVAISLRGVVGFGEVTLRLITTLDAELCASTMAENVFISRWNDINKKRPVLKSVAGSKRDTQVENLIAKLGFRNPQNIVGFATYLLDQNLVSL